MTRSRSLSATAAASAIILVILSAAAPAQGATLPEGQTLTVVDDVGLVTYTADPATAALTPVGSSPVAEDQIIMGIDVDDTGHGYLITTSGRQGLTDQGDIHSFDANTGAVGPAVPLVFAGTEAEPLRGSFSLDLDTNGTLWTSGFRGGDFGYPFIGTVDPDSGVVEVRYQRGGPYEYLAAIASDPTTGSLWVFGTLPGLGNTAAILDPTSGELGPVVELTLPIWGADFTSDGRLFGTTWSSEDVVPSLVTVDLASGEVDVIAAYPLDGDPINTFHQPAITVWGAAPALAATGVDVLPLALGTALLFLAGAAAILTRRIERR